MRIKYLFVMLSFLFLASAAFAGSVRIQGINLAPSYTNTGDLSSIFRVNLSVNGTEMNITQMNISFNNISVTNISGVFVYLNASSGTLVGSNTTFNVTDNFTTINFTTFVSASEANHTTLVIVINVSKNASPRSRFNISVNSANDIAVSEGHSVYNITERYSGFTQIQHVHSIGTITPHYIDTNVQNQSFVLYLGINGTDIFENISIKIPSQYPIANITELSNSTTTIYGNYSSGYSPFLNISFGGDTINLTNFTRGFNNEDSYIKINFTATSTSAASSLHVNITMTGSNLTSVNATDNSTSSMNVTTQKLITETVTLVKRTAIVNGTDFWEYNFTITITANVSGILQFRMNNWNSTTAGFGLLNITNESGLVTTNSVNYASLRNTSGTGDTNSGQLNISTEHGAPTRGLALRYTGTTRILVLKMIIPLNTPSASDYGTPYFTLFRSET